MARSDFENLAQRSRPTGDTAPTAIAGATIHIDVTELDGTVLPMPAYTARAPESGSRSTIILCPEIFGLNEAVRAVANRIAGLGFSVIAPSFLHRFTNERAMPVDAAGRERGLELFFRLTRENVLRDIDAALAFGKADAGDAPSAIVGFSAGGYIAFYACTQRDFAAGVMFYPGWIGTTDIALSQPQPTLSLAGQMTARPAKLLLLFGGADHIITEAGRGMIGDALKSNNIDHDLISYPDTPHGFFFDGRDTYRAEPAADAWAKMRALFEARLLGGLPV